MLDFVWNGFNNSSRKSNLEPRRVAPVREFNNHQQQISQTFTQNFQARRCYEDNSIADNFMNGNLFFPSGSRLQKESTWRISV